jgi:hypothetical protein
MAENSKLIMALLRQERRRLEFSIDAYEPYKARQRLRMTERLRLAAVNAEITRRTPQFGPQQWIQWRSI